ncbi:MAG: hypothetical protein HC800_05030 [Phormidesmis sp. RL_2_1]|nr:hypothetical protein [Phormidesmis sp. RL_2_1]
MPKQIAYLSQGRLYLHCEGAPLKEIESEFGKDLQQRRLQIQRKQAMKNRGIQSMTMSPQMLQQQEQQAEATSPIFITSLCALPHNQLLYSLESEDMGGLFRFDVARDVETRLFHNTEFQVSYLDFDPEQNLIACTKAYKTGSINLATMNPDAIRPQDITEGDSVDLAPRWIGKQALVYQSAGVSRNDNGYIIARAPFSIEKFDPVHREVKTLAEDPKSDLLGPQMDASGLLYYIRRPYKDRQGTFNLLQALKDILFVPLRLVHAIWGFFNSFTMLFTGKPLITADTKQAMESPQKLKAWGEALSPAKLNKKHQQDTEAPSLVPKTWELVRQGIQGVPEVLATSVLAYDLAADGTVVYTNGSGVYCIDTNGQIQRVLIGKMIEAVRFIG